MEVLGYDCDDCEIYEGMVLQAVLSGIVDIRDLGAADPRTYCAIKANDGNAYAISINNRLRAGLIREREGIPVDEPIPVVVKSISDMVDYEIACDKNGRPLYRAYSLLNELRKRLKSELGKAKGKAINHE